MIDYVTVLDSRGRFLWVSRTDPALRISPEFLIGQSIFELTAPEYLDELRSQFSKTLFESQVTTILGESSINGIHRQYRTTFHPIVDGTHAAVVAHSVEIPAVLLSEREQQVAVLIASDYSTKQIAARLVISASTVESHRQAISYKLGGAGIAGITRYCIRHGLITA